MDSSQWQSVYLGSDRWQPVLMMCQEGVGITKSGKKMADLLLGRLAHKEALIRLKK